MNPIKSSFRNQASVSPRNLVGKRSFKRSSTQSSPNSKGRNSLFAVDKLYQLTKNTICLSPTLNRSCNAICLVAFVFYFVYLMTVVNLSLPRTPNNIFSLLYLHTILGTVFFTLSFLFLYLRYFSTSVSQNTTSVLGILTCSLMGSCHVVELLGIAPHFETIVGRCSSLVRNGEWIVCIPLMICMFGHVYKIQERMVLTIAASASVGAFVLMFGSFFNSRGIQLGCGIIGMLLYLPSSIVCVVLTLKQSHLISGSNFRETRLYGVTNVLSFVVYCVFFLLNISGMFQLEVARILFALFDFFWVVFLIVLLFTVQSRSDITSFEIKLVDLEKANSAQKLFLRFVFHEVRVPFHSLLLGLEHLAAQTGLEEHQTLLSMLIQSAEMMHRTINDVLLLSRLEDGKLELESAPFSVSKMAKTTLQSFGPMAEKKKVNLACDVDASFPSLLVGDQHRISQILANLISNSIKFSQEEQTVSVSLTVLDQSRQTCYFQMKVQDQGLGMTAEDQKMLFKPFSQIRPHQTQEGRGSGLGLSIVKHIVELFEGSLSVQSELGKGSIFFVTLRLPVPSEGPLSARSRSSESEVEVGKTAFKKSAPSPEPSHIPTPVSQKRSLMSSLEKQVNSRRASYHWEHQDALMQKSSEESASISLWPVPFTTAKILVNSVEQKEAYALDSVHNYSAPASPVSQHSRRSSVKEESYFFKKKTLQHMGTAPLSHSNRTQRDFSDIPDPERSVVPGPPSMAKKALVVDDSQMNRKLTRMVLEQQGLEVEEACDGQEAVNLATKGAYWVIFMDNQMPVMNGVEATRHITEATNGKSTIIGLTGNSLDEDVIAFLDAGAKQVLIKPCKREKLLGVISSLENSMFLQQPPTEGKVFSLLSPKHF